jgi:hypothetical protein
MIELDTFNPQASIIVFQNNSETMIRCLEARTTGGTEGGDKSEVLRLKGRQDEDRLSNRAGWDQPAKVSRRWRCKPAGLGFQSMMTDRIQSYFIQARFASNQAKIPEQALTLFLIRSLLD